MKKGLSYRGGEGGGGGVYKMGRGFKSAHYGMIFSKIMETPSHGWKSYELGSVCPTIHRPSASFLGIGLQLFF